MKFISMFFTASAGIFGIYPKYITNERDKQKRESNLLYTLFDCFCHIRSNSLPLRGLPLIKEGELYFSYFLSLRVCNAKD